MKLCIGNTPVKAMNLHKIDMDTNDATIVASDMHAGMTAYARGKKVTGTGKCFRFASYGGLKTNFPQPVPGEINVIEIASTDYPVRITMAMNLMKEVDFGVTQNVAEITINGVNEQITVDVTDGMLTINCNQNVQLEVFYGKDDHV